MSTHGLISRHGGVYAHSPPPTSLLSGIQFQATIILHHFACRWILNTLAMSSQSGSNHIHSSDDPSSGFNSFEASIITSPAQLYRQLINNQIKMAGYRY